MSEGPESLKKKQKLVLPENVSISAFYTVILGEMDPKRVIFGCFCCFLACFLWEGGPKNFLGVKKFFFHFFTQKWFQKAKTWVYGTFLEDLRPFLAKVKKSFSHTFLNILGFNPKMGSRNGWGRRPSTQKLSKSF